ncbi:MAG TPA: kelch repeat-containing protein [Leptospiraceae bacterium]|nr:kelch repeat-containing protein [Leptospiraceae bacterium]
MVNINIKNQFRRNAFKAIGNLVLMIFLLSISTVCKANLNNVTDPMTPIFWLQYMLGNPNLPPVNFSLTGSLNEGRYNHTATLLSNGNVLIAGGYSNSSGYRSSAELYDPTKGKFTLTGSMTLAREKHTASLLNTGKILIVGGYNSSSGTMSSTELYDPTTGSFTSGTSTTSPRYLHTATVLQNGKVLLTGGSNRSSIGNTTVYATAELYDPAAGVFTATGSMNVARFTHNAVLLSSGKVLVSGGANITTNLSSAEVYDPTTGIFTLISSSMNLSRFNHTANTLSSGKVLIAGQNSTSTLVNAQVYDPTANVFLTTGAMGTGRSEQIAVTLPNGKILLTGGRSADNGYLADGEIYDEMLGTFASVGNMKSIRVAHTGTLLGNGNVLIVGGLTDNSNSTVSSAELYIGASLNTQEFTVTTFAGSGAGGSTDGTTTAASFSYPDGVVFDKSGNMFVADLNSNKIRKITASGIVTTFAGSGNSSSIDGTGTSASLYGPAGLVFDSTGNLYVCDYYGHKIRKITSAGVVTTLAGSGFSGGSDGTGIAASFNYPDGITIDTAGNLYVGDSGNHRIRKITSLGVVTTFAGSGNAGSLDGTGTAASFNLPRGVAVDLSGNVYVGDSGNNKVRRITASGVVTTIAGSGSSGKDDGTGTTASFNSLDGITLDTAGNLYVADKSGNKIRKIDVSGIVSTIAGTGVTGSADGTSTTASFSNPEYLAFDTSGNLYVADAGNNKIRKIASVTSSQSTTTTPTLLGCSDPTKTTVTVSTFAGSGITGSTDATGTAASFNLPSGVTVDSSGNLFVADRSSNKIRKITSAGVVTTLAGSGVAGSFDATGTAATFSSPYGVTADNSGNLYVADTSSNKIRKITSAGVVTTLAGSGSNGSFDATGTAATFSSPFGITIDSSGNLFVADTGINKIRKITSAGVVTTLAGSGTTGSTDATGTAASFNLPRGVMVDSSGNLFVADASSNKIRKITSAGVVTTLAGSGIASSIDSTGTAATFSLPSGVTIDSSGNLYVTDTSSNKIRKITSAGVVTTLAGSGTTGSIDATGTTATFSLPFGITIDSLGVLYVTDSGNNKIRKIVCQ